MFGEWKEGGGNIVGRVIEDIEKEGEESKGLVIYKMNSLGMKIKNMFER